MSGSKGIESLKSILDDNMNEYMLSPCKNEIWFIISLSEPVWNE